MTTAVTTTDPIPVLAQPHVMIDIETLSLRPDAAILSIGAVKFDPRGRVGELYTDEDGPDAELEFYEVIDLNSALAHGGQVDASTVLWWLGRDGEKSPTQEARDAICQKGKPFEVVMANLFAFYGTRTLSTWARGPQFDIVVLNTGFIQCGYGSSRPWKYDGIFDMRTAQQVLDPANNVPWDHSTVAHNALADAKAQAAHLQKLYQQHLV